MCPLELQRQVQGSRAVVCVISCDIYNCTMPRSMVLWHGAWVCWLLIEQHSDRGQCLYLARALHRNAAHMTGVQEVECEKSCGFVLWRVHAMHVQCLAVE